MNPMAIQIEQITLPFSGQRTMLAEASAQGYDFVRETTDDWASGANRFNAPGECFCGYRQDGEIVAIGGLNIDPFLNDPAIGRIRRVYVRQAWRNRGIGQAIVLDLIARARPSFRSVRLRAENTEAARLYERLGFVAIDSPDASHILHFEKTPRKS